MLFDLKSICAIFSTAIALCGNGASAASNGAPISPVSPTSSVPGHAFDRFVIITLENTVRSSPSASLIELRTTILLSKIPIFRNWPRTGFFLSDITVFPNVSQPALSQFFVLTTVRSIDPSESAKLYCVSWRRLFRSERR
jgi:hypothetical protein